MSAAPAADPGASFVVPSSESPELMHARQYENQSSWVSNCHVAKPNDLCNLAKFDLMLDLYTCSTRQLMLPQVRRLLTVVLCLVVGGIKAVIIQSDSVRVGDVSIDLLEGTTRRSDSRKVERGSCCAT